MICNDLALYNAEFQHKRSLKKNNNLCDKASPVNFPSIQPLYIIFHRPTFNKHASNLKITFRWLLMKCHILYKEAFVTWFASYHKVSQYVSWLYLFVVNQTDQNCSEQQATQSKNPQTLICTKLCGLAD